MKLPVTGSKHYLTYKGARHLGACGKALRAWRRDFGADNKLEVSTVVEKFHNHCIRCWLYNVMHETLLATKDEKEIAENLLDTIYCTCSEPHRSSHNHCLRCWLYNVMHETLLATKDEKEKEIAENLLDTAENLLDTIYCTCSEPHRSSHRRRITQPMRKRLEHVLRWLIEVLHRDLDKVKKIKFYRARGPRFD